MVPGIIKCELYLQITVCIQLKKIYIAVQNVDIRTLTWVNNL